jgi:hypothetical protein
MARLKMSSSSTRRLLNSCKDTGSPLAGRALACKPVPFCGHAACCMKPPLHLSPGASGEFGSHAIRPRSSHRMQVMTVGILRSPQKLPSSRRRPGSSVFRCVPTNDKTRSHLKRVWPFLLPSPDLVESGFTSLRPHHVQLPPRFSRR